MFKLDFLESAENKALSQEDKRFLDIVEQDIRCEDNHYVIPLPLKFPQVQLINNPWFSGEPDEITKEAFQDRWLLLHPLHRVYDEDNCKGYAKKVPQDALQYKEPHFCINHRGVCNQKKGKICVVFNCSQ